MSERTLHPVQSPRRAPACRIALRGGRWMLSVALLYAIVFLDQFTKELVLRRLDYGGGIVVVPGFFNLRHVRNTGAAWGMLSGAQFFLIVIAIGMLFFLLVYGPRLFAKIPGGPLWLGVLGAGITGNLIDRLRLGYVVDFLDFHWKGAHFPAFNVADSAIFLAIVGWMITQHLSERTQKSPRRGASVPAGAVVRGTDGDHGI